MIDHVSYFLIFFGGFMSWTVTLGLMLENDKQIYHYMLAGFMFSLGALQILGGLFVAQKLNEYSPLIFWHLPFMAWIGPTFFFAFRSANNDSFRMRPVDYLHFAFGVILVPVPIWLISIDTATKVFFVTNILDFTSRNALFRSSSRGFPPIRGRESFTTISLREERPVAVVIAFITFGDTLAFL